MIDQRGRNRSGTKEKGVHESGWWASADDEHNRWFAFTSLWMRSLSTRGPRKIPLNFSFFSFFSFFSPSLKGSSVQEFLKRVRAHNGKPLNLPWGQSCELAAIYLIQCDALSGINTWILSDPETISLFADISIPYTDAPCTAVILCRNTRRLEVEICIWKENNFNWIFVGMSIYVMV